MDDAPRPPSEQFQDSTRWLLIVLVAVSVLAAGVIAAADVAGLIGNKWQVVGAVSVALTVGSVLVAVFVVLRALDPVADDALDSGNGAEPPTPEPVVDEHEDPTLAQIAEPVVEADGAPIQPAEPTTPLESSPPDEPTPAVEPTAPVAPVLVGRGGTSRRAQRVAATRYHRARSLTAGAVVLAFLGMTGMTVAAVADGNNVESRQRRLLAEQLAERVDGPISEPQAVAVQLTTRGLRRVADAMGCTGAQIGALPVQGWAVSGTYRDPTVILFAPAGCRNTQIVLAPRDGFAYPIEGPPVAIVAAVPTTSTSTSTTTTVPATGAVGTGVDPAIPPATLVP